jgi:hypothetical protein
MNRPELAPVVRSLAAASMLLAATWLFPSAARADISTVYNGDGCKVQEASDASRVTRSGGAITVPTASFVSVMCPITKLTSGPGITNDQLYWAAVNVYSPTSGSVSCNLKVASAFFAGPSGTNVEGSDPATGKRSYTGTGTGNINFSSGLPKTAYWTNSTRWSYPYLSCTIRTGAKINTYTINERGSTQANHRIYGPAHCQPGDGAEYFFVEGDSTQRGGYVEGTEMFMWTCDIPSTAARGLQASVGPSISGDAPFKTSTNFGTHYYTIPPNPVGTSFTEFPTKIARHTYGAGARTLIFWQQPNAADTGDPKVFSFRTMPPQAISRSGWTVTASVNTGAVGQAIDGNAGTRWTTNTAQVNGQWFEIDLGTPNQTFQRIVLDTSGSANDFPHQFEVHTSNDRATLSSASTIIGTGSGSSNGGAVTTIDVLPSMSRYIRIYQKGAKSNWWSIHEVNVYNAQQ